MLLLQILIKASASQQWTHCLVKSKQFLAASQGLSGPPELGPVAVGRTPALGSPLTPLLQLVELCRVKVCFESTGSHTEGSHRTPLFPAGPHSGDDLLCCYEEGWAQNSALGLGPVPGGRPVRSRPMCTCTVLACVVTRQPEAGWDTGAGTAVLPKPHLSTGCSWEDYWRLRVHRAGLMIYVLTGDT